MLSAIARLNPYVDMKKIVIGLMDRLSSFAQRDQEASSLEEKKKAEEEATVKLLGNLRISKEKKDKEAKTAASENAQANGTTGEESHEPASSSDQADGVPTNGETPKVDDKASVADVPLYEIFYKQVLDLVKTRGLSIQDTMALLVSLANLAL